MSVLCEEQCDQLRVDGLVRAEITSEEAADEVSIYRSILTWKMDVFERAEKTFKICSEFLYLGGFSCSVQTFKYYKHVVRCLIPQI